MRVAIIGTGYVGLVSAACFAEAGHTVEAVDNNVDKIAALREGKVPIYEPGLDALIEKNAKLGRLEFGTDLAKAVGRAEVVFIAVGTPPRPGDGDADLSFVYAVAKEIGAAIRDHTVIVTKSTVPIGTGDEVERIIQRTRPAAGFAVVSNPEFLREGTAVGDFLDPDRIVIGTQNPVAREKMRELYASFEGTRSQLVFTARRTAELIKYAANAFLALRISFINEIADLCESVGADVHDVALGMGLDSRIGTSFLAAGPGYGGSCFPKDTLALLRTSQDHGVSLRLVQETVAVNEGRKRRMALKVVDALDGDVEDKVVAILGLTFKADTDDVRDAPAIPLIAALQRAGAHVRAFDPHGIENARRVLTDVEFFDDPYECVQGADAAALVTDWRCLRELDLGRLATRMRGRALVDFRNAIDLPEAYRAGFTVHSLGRPKHDSRDAAKEFSTRIGGFSDPAEMPRNASVHAPSRRS